MIAVALIVIDVDTRSSGMPSKSVAMSSIESIATPTRPDLAGGQRMVRVVADLGRQVERDAQAADALRQQVAIPRDWIQPPFRTRRTAASSRAGRGTWSAGCRGCTEIRPGSRASIGVKVS